MSIYTNIKGNISHNLQICGLCKYSWSTHLTDELFNRITWPGIEAISYDIIMSERLVWIEWYILEMEQMHFINFLYPACSYCAELDGAKVLV